MERKLCVVVMIARDLNSHIQLLVATYLIILLVCAFSLGYLLIKCGHSPFRTTIVILQIVTSLWLLFLVFEWVSFTQEVLLSNIRISQICLNFLAPLWLIMMRFFIVYGPKRFPLFIPVTLLIPAALSAVLLFPESSDIFKLYIAEFCFDEQARFYSLTWGPLESLTWVYLFICLFLIFRHLLKYFRNSSFVTLSDKIILLLVVWTPLVTHYLEVFFNSPYNIKPLVFSSWGVVTLYTSRRRQFFNGTPLFVWNIFNIAKESMVVLGADGSVNGNKAFVAAFGSLGDTVFDFSDGLSAELSGYIRRKEEVDGLEAEKDGTYYSISVKNVQRGNNGVMDQLVTISDVSEAKQLTLANERERIASNLHDSMGNCLIASINNLNLALMKTTLDEARSFIDLAATSITASLMMLRKIVEGLVPVDFHEVNFVSLVETVVDRISASGVHVDLDITGELEELSDPIKGFIYNACQEALTNAVIHGRAENIIIKIKNDAKTLWINILDDGRGCEEISKNHGLTTMENRVKKLNGKVNFGSPSSGGFGIYAQLPVNRYYKPDYYIKGEQGDDQRSYSRR